MFDIGWSEMLVIGIVALIVVGPKDLPMMFRKLGEFTGRARAMAREFSSAMDKAADESGVKDISRDLRTMSNTVTNPRKMGLDALNKAAEGMEAELRDASPNTPAVTPPVGAAPKPAAAAPDDASRAPAAAAAPQAPAPAAAPATDDRPA